MICPVCSVDISDLDLHARSSHVNQCIDMPPESSSTCICKENPPAVDLPEDGEKPSFNIVNKFTCPLCGNLFFTLTAHLVKCGPKHGVSPKDLVALIEAAKIAARHSSIPKKSATVKARKPRKKKSEEESRPSKRKNKKDFKLKDSSNDPDKEDDEDVQIIKSPLKNDSKSSNGTASKYPFDATQDQLTTKSMSIKNGRILAIKDLFTCDEINVRINKLFSGTIPRNHSSSQSSFSSQESTKSSNKTFEAASFLTEHSFIAQGFCKYTGH